MAKKILVVDDERHVVRLIQDNLERAEEEYEVVTAIDGKDALEKVGAEKPDLVILDSTLPDMAGFEVLRNIRKNPVTRELTVMVLLENMNADLDVFRGLLSGIDSYLLKPFTPEELISLVKRVCVCLDEYDENYNYPYYTDGPMEKGIRSNRPDYQRSRLSRNRWKGRA